LHNSVPQSCLDLESQPPHSLIVKDILSGSEVFRGQGLFFPQDLFLSVRLVLGEKNTAGGAVNFLVPQEAAAEAAEVTP
jgi:hypothetical protein